ncbi:translation initiation factor IF-2 [Phormidium sp. CCY1219]|jgi:hypothetical protein|uniref:translation initiation factor IF-2 n=1 Tax=Phormidium sp. CCY1219 TaxID=2886104 RepID=UPI002D1F13C3|nr:translation initiation factor IF-2 [Phormidium sp. CCY1219]MEB3826455.1 translation initiation factor IF-2 [Phormidium sp. CCY1219]
MGFADLSIEQIAEDYHLPVEEVLQLCVRLSIAYKSPQTPLPLEDAKAIISQIIAHRTESSESGST